MKIKENTKNTRKLDLIKDLKNKVGELEEKWKRALADYQNLEKRISKDQKDFVKYANASLIDKLLSILDDLERALEHHQDEGLKLIVDNFKEILKAEKVVEIKALNKLFNPETMEAIEMVSGKKDHVVRVVTKGYFLDDKVLRPVKVAVGNGERMKGR